MQVSEIHTINNHLLLKKSEFSVNEKELVASLKNREKRGFAKLYDSYSAALYGVILKIVRSEEIAQDVLQDSFVKIWKNIDGYDSSKGTLFTWILNIARNTAIDKTRSQVFKKNAKTDSIDINTSDVRVSTQIPIEHIGLEKMLTQLKPELQEIIDIVYFQGYTHSEAAKELNLPLGTVKTRVKIAVRELRKLI